MNPKALTFGSLFTGLGGLDLGLERAGLLCKWQVEISSPCRSILEKHFGGVPKFADVREVGAHNLAPVDVIAGGFPCQDISSAGTKKGVKDGERSGLWKEFYRIICELRPSYVIVENVEALRFKGRGLDIVLGDLAARRFNVEWDCLPAAAFGAPHRRDRIFLVAWSQSLVANAGSERFSDGLRPALFQAFTPIKSGPWASAKSMECASFAGHTYPGIPENLCVDDGLSAGLGAGQRRH